jgi:hypothetical protein
MFLGILSTSRRIGESISLVVFPITAFGLVILLTVGMPIFGVVGNLPAEMFSRFGYLFYGPLVRTGRATYRQVRFSRGVMMLFAGFPLLGGVMKTRGWLRHLTVSFSVIAGSWGLMRVGDMRFYVALRSFLPGVVLGILLSLMLLLINRASSLLSNLPRGSKNKAV